MTTGTVLAVKPGSREFGYALFQKGKLADYGVKSLRRSPPTQSRVEVLRRALGDLLSDEQPDALVLEQSSSPADADRYPVPAQVPETIKAVSEIHRVPVHELTSESIRKAVTGDSTATKRMVARAICHRYPSLHAPLGRHKGRQEWYALRMFDAMACGLTFLQLSQGNQS